ncbi:DUF3578 domain-containing protein [Candidatus Symbiopectobacterium sp. NZEC127]|uniref:MrcB family domain-containing protein n=1 Tax=Candidatus Symbiopectobacterium sp. NZEC127 TaxID=2820472 RepID=UPI0022280847|nr:DUF3578 domain-containing protein [Candidatus Symbiopectobacterium sp. NZEC127]MCW2484961.1 DUF3578 domain-containing protein [Candidatus Symbiopectobacterium sp. NZEC127]
MKFLSDVFEDYHELSKFDNKKINKEQFEKKYTSHKAIFQLIPDEFKESLTARLDEFIIRPSIGQGNVTDIPWVCILNKAVTSTPQSGYYIALLFSYDMQECYLSLNQGATEAAKICHGEKKSLQFLSMISASVSSHLTYDKNAICGEIKLKARSFPGTGYEKAAIQSFRYKKGELPSVQEFRANLDVLLSSYDNLIRLFSKSLYTSSEELFDLYALGLASLGEDSTDEENSENKKAKDKITGSFNLYPRDIKVASSAIRKAKFLCEYNYNHRHFKSKISNDNYVEAHHFIPLSLQNKFKCSLDIVENVVSLCPICHKILHHGIIDDKRPIIKKVFNERVSLLKNRGLEITLAELMKFYS